MPQRHHQGHKRTPKQLALIIKRCLPMVLTGSGMLCTTANAEEYYFDPIMLETTKSGMQTTDLSRFSKKYAQLPGTYQVDIWLNKKKVSQKKITFTANAEQLLQPQFTVEQLRELGIKVDEIPALAEKDDDSVINSLEQIIPGTYSAAIFLIPICISFDTAEKRRYATYLILNRRFSFEF